MTNERPPVSRESNRPSLYQTQGDSLLCGFIVYEFLWIASERFDALYV